MGGGGHLTAARDGRRLALHSSGENASGVDTNGETKRAAAAPADVKLRSQPVAGSSEAGDGGGRGRGPLSQLGGTGKVLWGRGTREAMSNLRPR